MLLYTIFPSMLDDFYNSSYLQYVISVAHFNTILQICTWADAAYYYLGLPVTILGFNKLHTVWKETGETVLT